MRIKSALYKTENSSYYVGVLENICCNRMIVALQKTVLFFHENKNSFGFETELQETDDPEELGVPQFIEIDYCPFCGTKIERVS